MHHIRANAVSIVGEGQSQVNGCLRRARGAVISAMGSSSPQSCRSFAHSAAQRFLSFTDARADLFCLQFITGACLGLGNHCLNLVGICALHCRGIHSCYDVIVRMAGLDAVVDVLSSSLQ